MSSSLFDRYGGFKTVSRIVLRFYEQALDSDQIGDHFAEIDMARVIDHQTKFIASLMGGPAAFSDERLRQVHRALGLGHADMDEMSRLLRQTLEEFDMAPPDIDAVIAEVEMRRPLIVSGEAAA